jgi:hypothetical protein
MSPVDERREHLDAARTLDRDERVLAAQIGELHVAAHLRLQVLPHLDRVAGVDDQQPAIGQAIEDHVVVRAAGVVGEHVVARLQRLHRRDVVDRERIGPRRDVVAAQFELRHVREIEQPGAFAHRVVLGQDPGVLHRHLVAAERHDARAGGAMHVEQRGAPQHLIAHAKTSPGFASSRRR